MSPVRELFEKEGPIARQLHGYEVRPQQIMMLEAVERAILENRGLVVEAGTGVGKSLAYLVPFIEWAVREDKKVVVSTYTKALQNQLYVKDLPFLSRVMGDIFRYSLCMGSENYVCLRKAGKKSVPDLFRTKKRKEQVDAIIRWLGVTDSGLVTDLGLVPDGAVWRMFSRESDMCLGRKCPYGRQCFYMKARKEQAASHILVTNHSLLFTDLMSDARVLPEFHALVLDEAHTLEDVATTHFGREVTSATFRRLLGDISDFLSGRVLVDAAGDMARELARETEEWVGRLDTCSQKIFSEAERFYGSEDRVAPLDVTDFFHGDTSEALEALSLSLGKLYSVLEDQESRELAGAYAQRCDRVSGSLDFLFGGEETGFVYWVEVKASKRKAFYSFRAAPIDISREMKTYLFDRISPVVLTSATLSLARGKEADFSFIRRRLGVEDCTELALDSPFDFENNVLIYLPKGIADPAEDPGAFQEQVLEEIIRMFDIMGGRIFALFTSYDMLNRTARRIAEKRADINVLKQGDMPRYVLLDVFKKNRDSVLLGTTTFWQGVDVPGRSLECVMITKLPFSVPTDPINAARISSIREEGLNPFYEYQLPRAVIMFKQGFGRLIRSCTDRGVVAAFDPRIRTRGYGREFIKALPRCRTTSDIGEVKRFFQHPDDSNQ